MLMCVVTLLAILAADAIAVPLSPAFPAGELRYILQNCGAGVLLSSEKYAQKAREVVSGLDNPVALHVTPKITTGSEPVQGVSLRDLEGHGGIMLYTSGTTNRPVCPYLVFDHGMGLTRSERCIDSAIRVKCAGCRTCKSVGI